MSLIFFLLAFYAAQAQELISVSVSVDQGVEKVMRLNMGQSPLEAAKIFVVSELSMDPLVGNEPSDVTVSLANILLTRLNEKNAADFQLQQEAERQLSNPIVFSFPVSINGNNVDMAIRAKSSASDSANEFCGSLSIDGQKLTKEALAQCVESAINLAIERITEYNNNQRLASAQKNEVPLFEVPIQIDNEVLPLKISVSENPVVTTTNFCNQNWGKISAILAKSYTEGESIDGNLCQQVLLSTVVGMIDQMMGSEEGKAAVANHRLFGLKVSERSERALMKTRNIYEPLLN